RSAARAAATGRSRSPRSWPGGSVRRSRSRSATATLRSDTIADVRFVAIAALAATFWIGVATLRLMIHGGGCAARHRPAPHLPARGARIEVAAPRLEIQSTPVQPGPLTRADVA